MSAYLYKTNTIVFSDQMVYLLIMFVIKSASEIPLTIVKKIAMYFGKNRDIDT